jgi:membrane protein
VSGPTGTSGPVLVDATAEPGWLDRLDARLQRHRATAIVSAVVAKWEEDGAGRLANLMAYSAFLAVFPLLLVLLTLAEVLLAGHRAIQKEVTDAAIRQFPEIGSELQGHVNGLTGRNALFLALVVVWLVYGCLRLSRNAQHLMATVWAVPRHDLPSYGRWLPRAVGFLAILGVGFVVGGALSGIGNFGGLGRASVLVGIAASLAVNVAMFWAGFAIVVSVAEPGRTLWRGAVLAGLGWTILQFASTQLVTHELRHYTTLYGTFASFLVLVWWIGLGTMLAAFAVELDVVIQRRLWPRSFRRNRGDSVARTD